MSNITVTAAGIHLLLQDTIDGKVRYLETLEMKYAVERDPIEKFGLFAMKEMLKHNIVELGTIARDVQQLIPKA